MREVMLLLRILVLVQMCGVPSLPDRACTTSYHQWLLCDLATQHAISFHDTLALQVHTLLKVKLTSLLRTAPLNQ